MESKFVSVLRAPDSAYGATESSPFRFEERATATCDVKFDYSVSDGGGRVTVYPSGAPVKFLKLRFRDDLSFVESVYGDAWERNNDLEWRSVSAHRIMPWFCYVKGAGRVACYGVKTGPDCFVHWQVDRHGVTLFLNLTSANSGTDLREPLVACEVVELVGEEGGGRLRRCEALCPPYESCTEAAQGAHIRVE